MDRNEWMIVEIYSCMYSYELEAFLDFRIDALKRT